MPGGSAGRAVPPGCARVGLLVFALLTALLTATAARNGQPGAVKYGVVFCAVLVGVVAFRAVPVGRRRGLTDAFVLQQPGKGPPRTVVHYSWWPLVVLVEVMTGCALLGAFVVVDFVRHRETVTAPVLGVVVFGAFALWCGSFPLEVLVGRIRPGWIAFSAQGVHRRGWASESWLQWAERFPLEADQGPEGMRISGLGARPTSRRASWLWRIDGPLPPYWIDVAEARVGVDPERVRRFVRFYLEHPGHRTELGAQASIDRVLADDFDTAEDPA